MNSFAPGTTAFVTVHLRTRCIKRKVEDVWPAVSRGPNAVKLLRRMQDHLSFIQLKGLGSCGYTHASFYYVNQLIEGMALANKIVIAGEKSVER